MNKLSGSNVFDVLKRSVIALLVCTIVVGLPLFMGVRQWKADAELLNVNKASALPAFVQRKADKNPNPPQLYKEPLISITFDDGWETTYSVAAPILMENGIRSTQYLVSGLLGDPAYLSLEQVKALEENQQQIGCHSVTHPDLTTLTANELDHELRGCRQYFASKGIDAQDFAAPYGRTNPDVINGIKKVFRSERSTQGAFKDGIDDSDINLAGDTDPYYIIGMTVHHDTTAAELQAAVDYTIEHNGWLVLTYHQAEEEGRKYSLTPESLKQQLDYLSSTPVRIVPVGEVMDTLKPKVSSKP